MAYFKDADEVYRYIGGIFEEALQDPELSDRLVTSGVVLRINCREPTATILVDMPKRTVTSGAAPDTPATVALSMNADVAHRFWLGKVNISMALAKGEMRAKGPVPQILKLVPVARQLFPRYRKLLEAAGRFDLVNGT
ncbi:MAG: SCP2 sterol-binding domain-containing protein [Actinomycetota bacterium]